MSQNLHMTPRLAYIRILFWFHSFLPVPTAPYALRLLPEKNIDLPCIRSLYLSYRQECTLLLFQRHLFFIQNIRGMQDTFRVISKKPLLTFKTCCYICESINYAISKSKSVFFRSMIFLKNLLYFSF